VWVCGGLFRGVLWCEFTVVGGCVCGGLFREFPTLQQKAQRAFRLGSRSIQRVSKREEPSRF